MSPPRENIFNMRICENEFFEYLDWVLGDPALEAGKVVAAVEDDDEEDVEDEDLRALEYESYLRALDEDAEDDDDEE